MSAKKKTTTLKTNRAKKKPKKTASDLEANLVDARALLAFVVKFAAAAKKAETKRKKKLLAKAIADAFKIEIHETATALNAQSSEKQRAAAASAKETKLRSDLHARVVKVRKLIQAAYPGDTAIAEAFGQGARLARGATQDVIAVSALQEQSFVDPKHASRARDAGLTTAEMAKQTDLRRTLEAADAAHTGAIGARKGQRLDAKALGGALRKRTTQLRKAAEVVFADDPKILAQLPVRRRRVVKKRAKKAPTAGAGSAAPATGA